MNKKKEKTRIVVENYLIEKDSITGYNLYKVSISQKGKSIGKPIQVNLGWNMPLCVAIKKIIEEGVKENRTTMTLNDFLELYRNETDKVVELVQKEFKGLK